MYNNYNDSRYFVDGLRDVDYYDEYDEDEEEIEEIYPFRYQRPYYRRGKRLTNDSFHRNPRDLSYRGRGNGIPRNEYASGYSHRRGPNLNSEFEDTSYSVRSEDLWSAQNSRYDGNIIINSSKNKRRISMDSASVYEEPEPAVFGGVAADKFEPIVSSGPCCCCTKLTMLSCVKCKSWYCSEDCQRKNWKQHREICVEMRPLRYEEVNDFENSHREEKGTFTATTVSDVSLGAKKDTEHDGSIGIQRKMKKLNITKGANDLKISDFGESYEAQVSDHERKDRGQNKVQDKQQGRRYQKEDNSPKSKEKMNECGSMEVESSGKSPQDGRQGNFMHRGGKRGNDGIRSPPKVTENEERSQNFRRQGMLMNKANEKEGENEGWEDEQEKRGENNQGYGNQGMGWEGGARRGLKSGRGGRGQNRSEGGGGSNQGGQRFGDQKFYGQNQDEGAGGDNFVGQRFNENNQGGGNRGLMFSQNYGKVDGLLNYERGDGGQNSYRDGDGQNHSKGGAGQNFGKGGGGQNYGRGEGGLNYGKGDGRQNFGKGDGRQNYGKGDGRQNYDRGDGGQNFGKGGCGQNYGRGGGGQNCKGGGQNRGKGGVGQNYGRGDNLQKFHGLSHDEGDDGHKFGGGQKLAGQHRGGDGLNYGKGDIQLKFRGPCHGEDGQQFGQKFIEGGQLFGQKFGRGGAGEKFGEGRQGNRGQQGFGIGDGVQKFGEGGQKFGQKLGESGQQFGLKLSESGQLFGQKLSESGLQFGQKWGESGQQFGQRPGGDCAVAKSGEGRQGNRGQQGDVNRERNRGSRRGGGNSNQKDGSGIFVRNQGATSGKSANVQEDWETENNDSSISSNLAANISQLSAIGESCAYQHTVELPSGKFSQVTVAVVASPGHYWVQLPDHIEDLKNILRIMNTDKDTKGKPITPVVGDLCSALYQDFVYRAKVLSIQNGKAKVHYIDFGNTDTCEFANIKEIPPSAMKYKAQAVEIVLAEGTSEKYRMLGEESSLAVRPVGKAKTGAVIVQVEGENYSKSIPMKKTETAVNQPKTENLAGAINIRVEGDNYSERNPMKKNVSAPNEPKMDIVSKKGKRNQWPSTVLNYLKIGENTLGEVGEVDNTNGREPIVVVTVISDSLTNEVIDIVQRLPEECQTLPKDPDFSPSKGDLVAALDGDIWKRAIVMGKESSLWIVALCDFGVVTKVKEVKQLPEDQKYVDAPALAVKCTLVQMFVPRNEIFSGKLKEGAVVRLKIIAHNGIDLEADMESETHELLCRVNVSMWKPEENVADGILIKSGCKVNILSVGSLKSLFVQPVDVVKKKMIQDFLLEVVQACEENEKNGTLKEPPSVGTIVGCKFTVDGTYYRALITSVKSSKDISVTYIDFGNKESVPLERICELPRELAEAPPCSVEIGLKTSNTSPFTEDVIIFLNKLILGNCQLILIYEDDLKKSVLVTESGVNINEKIDELLGPTKREKAVNKKSVFSDKFFVSSVEEEKLLADDEDSKEAKLLILSSPEKCHIACCSADSQHLREVYEKLPEDIAEYCEKCPNEPYKPISDEMCLAKYSDGQWYRASIMEMNRYYYMVYFIDFGNLTTVNAADIRKMTPDFMKVPVLATLCTYNGFGEVTIEPEQENRLKELIKENSVVTAKIWRKAKSEDIIIDVPEVTKTLKSERLLP